ncbi:MAG: HAMP domain-containing sensor histidine kinase [Eubacteriales bacterium]|nr:HAMP domain-containing sensor histidine kinase [Eubacteriales bacterium]
MRARHSTFFYLMSSNVIIILICVALLFTVSFLFVRDIQISNRMDALKSHAYDIAELSGAVMVQESDRLFLFGPSTVRPLLAGKLQTLRDEYAAYCLVFDRSGQVTTYFLSLLDEYSELKTTFDAKNLLGTLQKAFLGQEITAQIHTSEGPMFTVAVPLVRNGAILGAVYIQTAAQTVQQSYMGLALRIGMIALLILIFAAVIVWQSTRRFTQPLSEMAEASKDVAGGKYGRVVTKGDTKEVADLSDAFNSMSVQLQETDQVRRDFIANVSHELSSPMTSIQGFVQGILDGTVEKDDQRKYLQIVLDETKRLSKLVSGLLNLSRMESDQTRLDKSAFDIHELIRQVLITKMSAIEEKRHELHLDFRDVPLYVDANRDAIEQVLINLIDNAIKYTPPRGQITIASKEANENTIAVAITDNGIGILPEDAAHIFERFYVAEKSHTSGKGTGLGLAISRKIMEKHGQHIRLVPSLQGTTFEFTLDKSSKQIKETLHES